MAPKVLGSAMRGIFGGSRAYAAQAAAAAKKSQATESISLPKQELKTTTLPNGIIVASVESYSPISRVGIFLKAGPRYETPNKLGVVHALRNAAGSTTKNATVFGITRHLEYIGASLSAKCDRENVSFQVNCNRDHLDKCVGILAEVALAGEYRPWELKDITPRMRLDLANLRQDPFAVLLENLHRAAYRGGLSHSLCSPDYMVGKHSQKMILNYINETFSSGRAAIVGLGVDHGILLDYVARLIHLPSGIGISEGATKYQGGELFVDAGTGLTYVAIVAEGASLKNQKDVLSLALLQQILGTGPHTKYSDSSSSSKLAQAAAKATTNPFAVSSLNINYSDTGLFGFCLAGQPDDMSKLVKSVVGQMREGFKSVSPQDLAIAKHKLKAAASFSVEGTSSFLDEMGVQALATGQCASLNELEKVIDSITAQDIAAISSKVLKGKPSMAAIGELHATPHLDELI